MHRDQSDRNASRRELPPPRVDPSSATQPAPPLYGLGHEDADAAFSPMSPSPETPDRPDRKVNPVPSRHEI